MADRSIESAQALCDTIKSEITDTEQQFNEVRARLASLKTRLASVHSLLKEWGVPISVPVDKSGENTSRTDSAGSDPILQPVEMTPERASRPTDNTPKEIVARETRKLIEEHNEPIPREDLLNILTRDKGLKIEGARPITVLSTMMWRARENAELIHLRGHGYWLAERPYPPADYDPHKPVWRDRTSDDSTDRREADEEDDRASDRGEAQAD